MGAPLDDDEIELRYTCIGKGGEYRLIGCSIGAGQCKEGGGLVIYQDVESGQLFHRYAGDFTNRMQLIEEHAPTRAKQVKVRMHRGSYTQSQATECLIDAKSEPLRGYLQTFGYFAEDLDSLEVVLYSPEESRGWPEHWLIKVGGLPVAWASGPIEV